MTRRASIAQARDELSSLVNAVAHGRERIMLTSRGRPKAALVGLADLAALEELSAGALVDEAFLADADALRDRIMERREGIPLRDSADDLAELREGV